METGENRPVWNHRSSAPPGPLPKRRNEGDEEVKGEEVKGELEVKGEVKGEEEEEEETEV